MVLTPCVSQGGGETALLWDFLPRARPRSPRFLLIKLRGRQEQETGPWGRDRGGGARLPAKRAMSRAAGIT